MAMVCPKCQGVYQHQLECPTCGVRMEFTTRTFAGGVRGPAYGDGWQHAPFGRVVVGLVLAQGLALGFRMFFEASLQSLTAGAEDQAAAALQGVLLQQGVQALCLLVGATLAGAGQLRGLSIGALCGILNGVIALGLQSLQQRPVNEVVIYGQPLLHTFVGMVGGMLGSLIWRPLPEIQLAPLVVKKAKRPEPASRLFAGPIAWLRVLIGTAIVVVGVFSPTAILNFALYHSEGALQITSHMQSILITWEIIALFILLGAGFAGFNTFNGPKQGLCVGIAASFLIAGYRYSGPRFNLDETIFLTFMILSLSLIGSWFACRLFPPVLNTRHRRASEAP